MTSENPFRDDPQVNPYQSPQSPFQMGAQQPNLALLKEISRQATTALVVGIIGFFCFGIVLGPFAIYRGNKALRLIRENNIGFEHKGNATAGMIIGWIVLALNVLGLLFYAVMIAVAVSNQ